MGSPASKPLVPPRSGYGGTVIDEIRTATESFWHFLSDIALLPLFAAICCHLLKLCCTSRAWRNVLAAAYPDRPVRWPPILAAYVAGVGVNAIIPARAGDAVRIFMAHRAIPGSSYTTVVSSNVVLTFVDMALALVVFIWALTQGVLPSLDALSRLPSFDYSWAVEDGVVRPPAVIAFIALVAGATVQHDQPAAVGDPVLEAATLCIVIGCAGTSSSRRWRGSA